MKTARRQAREVALQALYAWQLSGEDPIAQARSIEGFEKTDAGFVEGLLRGVLGRAEELRGLISPHLSREFGKLSPIERAILYIGTFELASHPETPFKVVLNEAVELGKSFGATDGYRFVNGVLEKIAAALRPDEVARGRTNV
jgi:transcription antitermination protein NusB